MCAYICMCTYIVTVNNLIFISWYFIYVTPSIVELIINLFLLNVLKFHKCFLIILTTVHVCVRFYEGPLQISASALNGIPSLNKDYLIRFDLIKYY